MGRTACTEPQCLYKGAVYLNSKEITYHRNIGPNLTMKPQKEKAYLNIEITPETTYELKNTSVPLKYSRVF